jgi:hypothetical protein
VFGGTNSTGVVGTNWKYNISTMTWSPIASLPFPPSMANLAGGCAVTADNRIFYLGGVNGSYYSSMIFEYDRFLDTFYIRGSFLGRRSFCASVEQAVFPAWYYPDSLIVITGGITAAGITSSIEMFNVKTGTLTSVGNLITPRAEHAAFK